MLGATTPDMDLDAENWSRTHISRAAEGTRITYTEQLLAVDCCRRMTTEQHLRMRRWIETNFDDDIEITVEEIWQ